MSIFVLLYFVALVLAILSVFVPERHLLAVSVVLLAMAGLLVGVSF